MKQPMTSQARSRAIDTQSLARIQGGHSSTPIPWSVEPDSGTSGGSGLPWAPKPASGAGPNPW